MNIDPDSAWFGALAAFTVILLLVVVLGVWAVLAGRRWVTGAGRTFRAVRLERAGGQLQITSAFVEPEQPRPSLAEIAHRLPEATRVDN